MKEKYFFMFIINISSNLFSLYALFLLALCLDIELLGNWFFLNSIVNIGFLLVDIGIDSIHYQYSSKKNISDYFGTFFSLKFILVLLNTISTLLIIMFLHMWNTIFLIYLLLLLGSKILVSVATIFLIDLKTKIKVFKSEFPLFLNIIGKNISIIYLAVNKNMNENPLFFLCVSYIIFDSFLILIAIFISKSNITSFKFKKDYMKLYMKDVKPLIFYAIISVIAANIGNLILDINFGHKALGYFGFVNIYLIPLLLMISGSLITLYVSLFSKYFENQNIEAVKQTTYIIEKYSSIIYLSIIIFVFLNVEIMFYLFLPKYLGSVPIIYILIFMPYLIGITRPYAWQMVSGKKQTSISLVNTLICIITIFMMIILIPRQFLIFKTFGLGSIGYALSLTVPWILWVFLSRYLSYKYFGIKSQKKIILHIFLAFLSFLLTYCVNKFIILNIFQNLIIQLFFSTIFSLGFFFGLLLIFRELKQEDLKFLMQLFNVSIFFNSISKEFSK